MSAPVYATAGEYTSYTDGRTASEQLLAAASRVIDELLTGAVYDVDDDDQPTDSDVAEAVRDATCAQAQWFDLQGDTSGTGFTGGLGSLSSASIGSASYTKDSKAGATASRAPSGVEIAPAAVRILRGAGLLSSTPYVYG